MLQQLGCQEAFKYGIIKSVSRANFTNLTFNYKFI
jgi:hypothetical protein